MDGGGLPVVNYLLQHTLRGLCSDSQWVYAVFWRILPRNYPPPKWDTEGGIMDRSKGNKRNWILVWEDGYCDFSSCARAATSLSNRCSTTVSGEGADEMMTESFQPELFFKMSHEVYNYGEGLMGKVAADNSHKWVYKEPPENDMNFLSSWHGSLDPHPRTWEAQFKSGIQTIAVVAVREGLIQLGSLHKIVEDLNFVIFLQRKFNYLQSIPGVFAIHPPLSFDLRRSKMASSSSQENPSCDGFNNHGDHHDKICPSPTKDLNHPHSHTQLAGMKRPPDQFIDMSKQNTVPALYGSCLSPNKAMNAGWNTRQASINNNSTIVLPLMQPSMSSLQALLSKLPSVTSAEQTSSHFPASLEAVRGVSSLNARNPVTNPLESSEASSFQKSCLTLNSTAHMSTSPSGHADFADSKLHVRHQEATGSNSSSHHGGLCPNFLDSCSNPLQLHENHGDLELEGLLNKLDEERAPASLQEAAARGVLQRLLPSHSSSFHFEIVSKTECGEHACFLINNHDSSGSKGSPEIIIKGSTGIELSAGLHWYLKYWCGAHVSWDKTGGVQLASVPQLGSLPRVQAGGVRVQRATPWNYYQNVVTSSYSYVWWDWERWEKEIDWMALQGVNLPLAFTGQEAIWQKVFQRFNLSQSHLDDFFGGPAFLAWARMGNLHGWGGPLSRSWLQKQLILQKKILYRMRELGMTPVLPAFSGNVPAALQKIFPSAKITQLGDWNTVDRNPRWCCTFLLDPTDALFVEIGQTFVRQQIKEYGGTSHIYNCDTFNENQPPSDDPEFISSLGTAVFHAMHAGDKDAVWLMQGWLFSSDAEFWKPPQMKALLHSVPSGKMIVIDLFAEVKPIWKRSEQFYGTPYIWCMLHNFGGNIEMYGILDAIASGPVDSRTSQNSAMVGVGMCMEGIEQNPVVYELMSEMAFRNEKVHVEEWIKNYSQRRYGKVIPKLEQAWDILYQTLYNCTDGVADHNKDFIVEFPDVDPSLNSESKAIKQNVKAAEAKMFALRETYSNLSQQPHLWYSPSKVVKALHLFLESGDVLTHSFTYRYDLVDITRQALAKLANQIYLDVIIAFSQKDVQKVATQSKKFLDLIINMDILLASDSNFLLGPWLESAKHQADNPKQRRQYEWNARTQLTMWFDDTEVKQSKLHDYANKYWSGLLQDYYFPRASIYFEFLLESMETSKAFPLDRWRRDWIMFSNKWQEGTDLYSVKAEGNALEISRALFQKYF